MRNNLYTLLKADEKQVRKIIVKYLKENGYEPIVTKDYIFAIGSVPVMLLAHYDTVPNPPKYIENKAGVLSAKKGLGADDRAGIYAILEVIRNHHCHVLFCGGEETGGIGSTLFSHDFKSGALPEFDVNYCIQLDRRGSNDAVYYDGDNEEFEDFIEDHGWKSAWGSFTDICNVCPALGVMGVNLSIGYQNEHTKKETLDTAVMNANIKRIPELLDGKKFEWKEAKYTSGWYGNTYYGGWGYEDYGYYGKKDKGYNRRLVYRWLVEYEEGGESHIGVCYGSDEYAAVGWFLMENDTLTFNSISDIVIDDVVDDEYAYC